MAKEEAKRVEPKGPEAARPVVGPVQSPAVEPCKSASALLDFMQADGTPVEKLEEVRAWMLESGCTDAAILYKHMEAHSGQVPGFWGTLNKAGKWIWETEFKGPALAMEQHPEEEITQLRKQVGRLETALKTANAEKLGYLRGRDLANERANDLQRQFSALKAGRSAEELSFLGIK